MVTVVITLLIISFLEGAFLPWNLVFIALLCRTFIAPERSNYHLAFWFGLLLSLLLNLPLGALSIFYLVIVFLIGFARRAQFASNWMVVWPISFIFLAANQLVVGVISGTDLTNAVKWEQLGAEGIMILPIYFLVRFWEERFVPKQEIRLKVGK